MSLDGAEQIIAQADEFWNAWVDRSPYDGPGRGLVERSVLALGLLHSKRHQTLAAAGTFGLPEAPGGERNWDYRYVWVRDTSFGARAIARAGQPDLAQQWMRQVLLDNASCDRSPLRLMMAVDTADTPAEETLEDFSGHMGATPVRIGNEAANQLQLDIFGEIVIALRTLCDCGAPPPVPMLERLRELLDWLLDNWNRPDSSIWELRGDEKHYLFSRLMCWVAFSEGTALFECTDADPNPAWAAEADKVAANIRDNFWCPRQRSYMQTAQCSDVDAAVIFMRLVGFLKADDPRWHMSRECIKRHLVKETGVLRYPHSADDGFDTDEGTFVLCTFWWAQALHLDGFTEQARALFDSVVDRAGSTGLLTEEIGEDGTLLGNLPQVFSHAALIDAWLTLQDHPAR